MQLTKPGQSQRKFRSKLDIVFLCDCSGSMSGQPIAALNTAMERLIQRLKPYNDLYPHVQFALSAIRFANHAHWHLQEHFLQAESHWPPIHNTGGLTSLGAAYRLLIPYFQQPSTLDKLSPVLLLLTDGKPTDDADSAIYELVRTPQGKQALCYAIGIGHETSNEALLGMTAYMSNHLAHTHRAVELTQLIENFVMQGIEHSLSTLTANIQTAL